MCHQALNHANTRHAKGNKREFFRCSVVEIAEGIEGVARLKDDGQHVTLPASLAIRSRFEMKLPCTCALPFEAMSDTLDSTIARESMPFVCRTTVPNGEHGICGYVSPVPHPRFCV